MYGRVEMCLRSCKDPMHTFEAVIALSQQQRKPPGSDGHDHLDQKRAYALND